MSHHVIPQYIKNRARALRKKQTFAEKILWDYLKNRGLDDLKWYRQHPICIGTKDVHRRYIADFRCHVLQLVIEVDGTYHFEEEQQKYDSLREDMIDGLGIHVLRFTNEQVKNNIEEVIQKIKNYKK